MPADDDDSSAALDITSTEYGFHNPINFFGTQYTQLYVNKNGNITFDSALSDYTPFSLVDTQSKIIAPFFADVDTREGTTPAANTVDYGLTSVDSHRAFAVTWTEVGCYFENSSVQNSFQLILIERSDISEGDFDIEFNYDQIQWEAGTASGGDANCLGGTTARAGFSNGSQEPGTYYEMAGSGVAGAFLDTNPTTGLIYHSLDSDQPGRYVFHISGQPLCQPTLAENYPGVTNEAADMRAVANDTGLIVHAGPALNAMRFGTISWEINSIITPLEQFEVKSDPTTVVQRW